MSPFEAYNLIKDIESDYIRMVRDLNVAKRKIKPVDPWSLPLVERMEKAMNDLALAAGIDRTKR